MAKFRRKKLGERVWKKLIPLEDLEELDVDLRFDEKKLTIKDMKFFDKIMSGEGQEVELDEDGNEVVVGMGEENINGMIGVISRFVYAEMDGEYYRLSTTNAMNWIDTLDQEEFTEVVEMLLVRGNTVEDEKN